MAIGSDHGAMNNSRTPPRPRPLPSSVIRALALLGAAVALFAVVASPASAASKPKLTGKFTVSGVGTNNEITQGPDGNIWVTLDQANDIAQITPNGKVKEFDATNIENPIGIASGPGKELWVTQPGGVAVFDPADPDSAEKFAIGGISDPRPIVRGPDGNMWTVSGDKVIRISAADPTQFTSFPVLVAGRDIDRGKDGNLWAADFGGQVVKVDTDGNATAFDTGAGSGPQALAAGPKGEVGYADPTSNPQIVGRIVKDKVRRTRSEGDPFGVAYAAKTYWMPRFASNDVLTLDPKTGKARSAVKLGQNVGPRRITTGPDNNLWVTLDGADKIARVSNVG